MTKQHRVVFAEDGEPRVELGDGGRHGVVAAHDVGGCGKTGVSVHGGDLAKLVEGDVVAYRSADAAWRNSQFIVGSGSDVCSVSCKSRCRPRFTGSNLPLVDGSDLQEIGREFDSTRGTAVTIMRVAIAGLRVRQALMVCLAKARQRDNFRRAAAYFRHQAELGPSTLIRNAERSS